MADFHYRLDDALLLRVLRRPSVDAKAAALGALGIGPLHVGQIIVFGVCIATGKRWFQLRLRGAFIRTRRRRCAIVNKLTIPSMPNLGLQP